VRQIADIRVLPGPNPDVPGPAVRVSIIGSWDEGQAVVHEVLRASRAVGLTGEDLVLRPTDDGFVVAVPVPDQGVAKALVVTLKAVLDGQPVPQVTISPRDPFDLIDPSVACVAISGTNGKTTTTRLIAHCARTAGFSTAWSSTDGVFHDGRLVQAGDFSGPGGARRVLAEPGVQFAVLETARGGLLLRGMSVRRVDVGVVTNVAADHLGSHGINTVEQLAMVKATVVRIVDPGGWVVLNADEPLVRHMADQSQAPAWYFGLDSDATGQRFTTVREGRVVVEGDMRLDLGPVVSMPVTVGGHARFNLLNVLAAASGALAAGITPDCVGKALLTFRPDARHSSGRFNCWQVDGRRVVLDMAHNVESLRELLVTARAVAQGQVWVAFGTAGDRADEVLQGMGFAAADLADHAFPLDKPGYLRDRSADEMRAQFVAGMTAAGADAGECFDSELEALVALVERSIPGDVVVVTVAEQLLDLQRWLTDSGGQEADPGLWLA
jgi:cyanophycin synthetase